MVRGKTTDGVNGSPDIDGAATGASPGTLGTFTYNGATELNPNDHADASGICGGSRHPFCGDGHVDPRQIIDLEVMNGDFPAPLLAFDEDDEVFVISHRMAFFNKGWPVNRRDREDVVIGNFCAERLVVEEGPRQID